MRDHEGTVNSRSYRQAIGAWICGYYCCNFVSHALQIEC